MSAGWSRVFIGLGGLAGLLGVALAAAAAHLTGGGDLETASRFLLAHAPALVALGAMGPAGPVRPVLGRTAGIALALGLVLFCGDLAVRATLGLAPLRLAAPTGGVLLMAGWALLGLGALVGRPAR